MADHAAGESTQALFEGVASDPTLPRAHQVRPLRCLRPLSQSSVLESFVLVTARGEEEVCVHLLALRSSSAGEQSSLISVRLTAADALGREGAAAAEL